MEQELFEELIGIVDLFWHRYAKLPFTSRYSGYSRASYFKQSNAMLVTLLQFCVASNFVRLEEHSIQSLLKHRFSVEYNLFSKSWKWIEDKELSKKYKQKVLNQLVYYTPQFADNPVNPRVVGTHIISSQEATHYISGIMRRFQTKEKLVFFLYAIENKYTSDIQPNLYFTDKEKLRQVYERYFENPTQNLSEYIRQQGFGYKEFQKSFQRCFGTTLHEYHRKNKLLLSLAEIMFTLKRLKEIAHDFGYENYISYYRSFVKNFSKTPKEIIRFKKNSF